MILQTMWKAFSVCRTNKRFDAREGFKLTKNEYSLEIEEGGNTFHT